MSASGSRSRLGQGTRVAVLVTALLGIADFSAGPEVVLVGLITVGPCLAAISAGPRSVWAVGAYAVTCLALLSGPDRLWWTWMQAVYVLSILAVTAISAEAAARREAQQRRLASAESESRGTTARVARLAEQRRLLIAEALNAEDRERERISESIHDDALQLLLAARQDLAAAARGDQEALRRGTENVLSARNQLRRLMNEVAPIAEEFSTPAEAVHNVVARQAADHVLAVDFDLDESAQSPHARLLVRAARQLMANVITHAHATHVTVALQRIGDELELRISDDGVGFTPRVDDAVRAGHIGLASLASRAEAVGGTLRFTPVEIGSDVRLRVPAAVSADPIHTPRGATDLQRQDAANASHVAFVEHRQEVGRGGARRDRRLY